ncbi:MAG: hypothetical protein Q7S56_01280 [Nanoarchaeota archaeon]|nr:hypothetical protein [Nanoarchaeota archaeon]
MKITCFDDEIIKRIDTLNKKVKTPSYRMRMRNAEIVDLVDVTQESFLPYSEPARVYEIHEWARQ